MASPRFLIMATKGDGLALQDNADDKAELVGKIKALNGDAKGIVIYELSKFHVEVVENVRLFARRRERQAVTSEVGVTSDGTAPKRRGRPPGSKNKLKAAVASTATTAEEVAEAEESGEED